MATKSKEATDKPGLFDSTMNGNRPEIKKLIDKWKDTWKEENTNTPKVQFRRQQEEKAKVKTKLECKIPITLPSKQISKDEEVTCLHLAAGAGSVSLLKLFCKYNINVNMLTKNTKETPLKWAVRYGQPDAVAFLIKKGGLINPEYSTQTHPLHWVIENGNYETFHSVVEEAKADMYLARPSDRATPLHTAAQTTQSFKIAKKIIDESKKKKGKCDECDPIDSACNTPLIYAAQYGNTEVVSALLETHPNIYHQNMHIGDVWNYALASEKSDEIVTSLTEYCRDSTNETSKFNKPPSIILTERWGPTSNCSRTTMDIVFKPEIIYNERDEKSNSCLHLAARDRKQHIIEEVIRVWESTKADYTTLEQFINTQNEDGYTALHYACQSGSDTIISILIENGANVSEITNEKKMPIHIAASSKYTTIKGLRILVEHMKEKAGSRDGDGNNALDLACTFGFPEMVWELKDLPITNEDDTGCTPLHEAAKLSEPIVLKKVLEIFKIQKGTLNLDRQNKNKETVLHLASKPGFENEIAFLIENGATLDIGDNEGNTILHRLVKEVAESSEERTDQLMNLIKFIFEKSVRWWCLKNNHPYQADDKILTQQNKRNAIIYLTQNVYNKRNLSVIELAFKHGTVPFIELVMNMPDIMSFKDKRRNLVYYDITNVMKRTINSDTKRAYTQRPYIELMTDLTDNPERVLKILDIEPMRDIEKMYTLICKRTLALVLFLHVLYMSVFSYLGVKISAKFRNTTAIAETDQTLTMAYAIVPLEPLVCFAIILAYARRVSITQETIARSILKYILLMVYITLTTIWLFLIAYREPYHDHVLSLSLFIGWTGSLSLTRGFKGIHYFYKMLLHMLIHDIFKVLFVYSFVLLAFGFAFRVLLEISEPLVSDHTTGDTLFKTFNLMLGMEEIFTDEFKTAMEEVGRTTGFVRVFYIVYIVLSTIIIFNLLIAMMNDSYSKILKKETGTWRMEAILLGMSIEYSLPKCIQNTLSYEETHRMTPPFTDNNAIKIPTSERCYIKMINSKRTQFLENN